ncbi:MAG: glycogen/starch synthase [Candidatus Woesearchaeota archaeon]
MLFEASWEICNKVGGIYTVVKSKIRPTQERYGENYFLFGPYFPKKVQGEFEEKVPRDFLRQPFDTVRKEGIVCHFGNWLVPGNPNTILIDFSNYAVQKNSIKTMYWEEYKIDSMNTEYFDYDEPMVWSTAVGRVIEEIMKELKDKKAVAHLHEWLAGGALLHLASRKVKIGTVFTTHATMLGRTLASHNINLYSELKSIDPEKAAYTYKVATKFQTERACAQHASVFTTVSEITGMEAEHFFSRKPDILLLNGLDLTKFPTFEESTIKHRAFRTHIREFLMYYFFPYYSFNLQETLIYFICGRYEFHDKGIDILIKALGKLNEQLKKEKSSRNVVCFFWIPGNIKGIKPELLESKTYYNDVKDSLDDSMEDIKNRLVFRTIADEKISTETLFDHELVQEIKRKVLKLKRNGSPGLCTHDLYDEGNDAILNALKKERLLNKKDDKVRVVYYPIYLTGADGMLDLGYYESMQGSHLGIFPSVYEPWGYTPLESGALGVPAITTDLAGFGRYISGHINEEAPGIFVLHRFNKTDDEATEELAGILLNFAKLTKQKRVQNKIEAKNLAATADWKKFIELYITAHNMAIERAYSK